MMRRSFARMLVLAALIGLCTLLRPRVARATDSWAAPYPGVRHLHRTAPDVDYHVILVDLRDPRVEIVATRPDDRFVTTSEFARRYEADIAVNANFFDHGSCGLMAGRGEVMENAYDDNCRASLAFGRENEAAMFDSLEIPRGPLPASWMSEVLSGKPFLMRDGRAPAWVRPQHLYRPNPRTALGLTRDRHTLVMLVADGRRGAVNGLTGFQMVAVFREFDVTDAINLDGGGSTELVMGGRIRNHPSDHRERVVISHLGIRVHDGAAWYAAEIVGHGGADEARAGASVPLWIEARNLGRATWREGNAPRLEVDDGLVPYMATPRAVTAPGEVARFEFDWLARGRGARRLRARLVSTDGRTLDDGTLGWQIAVRGDDTPVAPVQRASAVAQANEMVFPGGLGAVTVRAGGCAVRSSSNASSVGSYGLSVLAALVAIARRRKR